MIVYSLILNFIGFDWHMVWYIHYLWSRVVESEKTMRNMMKKETNEEYDEDWVEEGFELVRLKFDRDGVGHREALDMVNCSINIWDESELELAWSKKRSSYFENKFPIFLLPGISNTTIFKDVWRFALSKCISNENLLQHFP